MIRIFQHPPPNSPAAEIISAHFDGDLLDTKIAVWGMGCHGSPDHLNPETCVMINWLLERGADVVIHDRRLAHECVQMFQGRIQIVTSQWDAVRDADALVVAAASHGKIDAGWLRWHIGHAVLFDVAGAVDMESLRYSKFACYRIEPNDPATAYQLPINPDTDRSLNAYSMAV